MGGGNRMNKGVVMDVLSEREAIVLTSDGQFLKVAPQKSGFQIGEEVAYSITQRSLAGKKRFGSSMRWIASIAAVFLVFFIGLPGYFGLNIGSQEVEAYVSVDINPSVEFGINSHKKVVNVKALNAEAEELLEIIQEKTVDQDLSQAINYLILESKIRGFINEDTRVIISTTKLKENVDLNEIEEKITEVVAEQEKENTPIQITSIETSTKFREEALKNGLTAGKFAVYVTAKSSGNNVSIDEVKKESVKQMNEAIEFIKKEKAEKKNLAQLIDQQLDHLEKNLPSKAENKFQEKNEDKEKKLNQKTEQKDGKSPQKEIPAEISGYGKDKERDKDKNKDKEVKANFGSDEKKLFLQIKKWSDSFKKSFNKNEIKTEQSRENYNNGKIDDNTKEKNNNSNKEKNNSSKEK